MVRIEPLNFRSFDGAAGGNVVAARRHSASRKEEAPPAPPPPPTFSEEELKAAEMKGYQRGFLEGCDDGKRQAESEQAEINRQLSDTTQKLLTTLRPLIDDYKAMTVQLHSDLPKVALAIARKVAGPALEHGAEAIVSQVALACVETMIGEPRLHITVHPALAATLESRLNTLVAQQQMSVQISVSGDDAMAHSDCRIAWKHGAMERHSGQLWQEIERVVENMVASAPRHTEKQLQQLEAQLSKE
ncbi:MAG: FliH/SctL family protein [Alphaproteobacteria bacterium]|nr:FliH/SctL family protein [Alphaproteobacteria bacterium]